MRTSKLIGALLFVSLVAGGLLAPDVTAQSGTFTPDPAAPCGVVGLTFCDNFDEGPAAAKGRAGDLDPSRWTAARLAPLQTAGGEAWDTTIAPVPACKASLPVGGVFPDQDALICDPTGSYSARLMTAVAFQNYGVASFMIRQPFDFANRVGKIYFDVDNVSLAGGASWVSLDITPDPIPAPNIVNGQEHAQVPPTGLEIEFDNDGCAFPTGGAQNSVRDILSYVNYQEAAVPLAASPACFNVAQGKLNHMEVDLSQNHIDIYASDNSSDEGKTFPNFRLIGSASLNLPFTRGYVHLAAHNHATVKYGYGPDWVYHWDNVGFDGPAVSQDRQYDVPDSLARPDASMVNVGYEVLDNSGPSGEGTYTCCTNGNPTKISPFTLNNVDLSGATRAAITLDSFYCRCGDTTNYTSYDLKYRLNGGAWHDRFVTPAEAASVANPDALGNITQVIDVPLAELHQGSNTLEFATANTPKSLPPIIGGITLVVFSSGSSAATPTLVAPTATTTPPPATPAPTDAPVSPTSTQVTATLSAQLCSLQIQLLGTVTGKCVPQSGTSTQVLTPQTCSLRITVPGNVTGSCVPQSGLQVPSFAVRSTSSVAGSLLPVGSPTKSRPSASSVSTRSRK